MKRPTSGSIVIVDWRRGGIPTEPNKLRPAVVIEDSALFDDMHASCIVVPLTTDQGLAIPALSVAIDPSAENGCRTRSYALAFNVTTVSLTRVKPTSHRVTMSQVETIRHRIGICMGLV